MLPYLIAGTAFFKKHWGKVIAGFFILAWVSITFGLYNSNQDLTMELGGVQSAVDVCISERTNMDNELILLKADLALTQAENDKYKADIANAEITIKGLGLEIVDILDSIDNEPIAENCEAAVDWMRNKALAR